MKRSILLGFMAPVLFAGSVEAGEPSHSCYISDNGRTTDLSYTLCRNKPRSDAEMRSTFLAELKWKVAYAPRGEFLVAAVEKNSEAMVQSAKAYCQARKEGMTDAQLLNVQRRSLPPTSAEGLKVIMTAVKISNQLAVKNFCPELL